MSRLTLSQRTTRGKGDRSSDLSRLLLPGFAHSLAPREVSRTEPSISAVMVLNAHAQLLLATSALQAAHNCPLTSLDYPRASRA